MSEQTAITPSATETPNELAAREQVKAPENTSETQKAEVNANVADNIAREPLKPVEQVTANLTNDPNRPPVQKPEQILSNTAPISTGAVAAVIPVHHSNVVSPEAFVQAEQNIAAYLGNKIDPSLTKNLQLTLSNVLGANDVGNTGLTDVKLCFVGPMIEANFAEMSREIANALTKHPVIAPLLKETHMLRIEQADSAHKGQMLHIQIPGLTAEKYALLINTLAAQTSVATPKSQADETVSQDSPTEPTAPTIKQPVIAPYPTTGGKDEAQVVQMDAPKAETPVKKDEAPAATVEAPVLQMGTQSQDTELKRA